MFKQKNDLEVYHIAKGLYLTSNNVVVDFNKIGSNTYAKVIHKSSLNIINFSNPVKSQSKVLSELKPFLSKYNFNLTVEEIREEVNNIGLRLSDEVNAIKSKTAK